MVKLRTLLAIVFLAAPAARAAERRSEQFRLDLSRSAPIRIMSRTETHFGIAGLFYAGGSIARSQSNRFIGAVGMGALSATAMAGQTAMAYSMASVVTEEYDSPLAMGLCYGLATALSVARTSTNANWGRDLAVNAAIGVVVGKGLSRWEKRHGWGRFLYTTGNGLFLRKRF
jgi:hypothetical protein